jgi:hypothetical protein
VSSHPKSREQDSRKKYRMKIEEKREGRDFKDCGKMTSARVSP